MPSIFVSNVIKIVKATYELPWLPMTPLWLSAVEVVTALSPRTSLAVYTDSPTDSSDDSRRTYHMVPPTTCPYYSAPVHTCT